MKTLYRVTWEDSVAAKNSRDAVKECLREIINHELCAFMVTEIGAPESDPAFVDGKELATKILEKHIKKETEKLRAAVLELSANMSAIDYAILSASTQATIERYQ